MEVVKGVCSCVPRRLQKLFSVLLVVFLIVIFLLVTHVIGFYIGIASREYSMNDKEIRESIPKQIVHGDEIVSKIKNQVKEYSGLVNQRQKKAIFSATSFGTLGGKDLEPKCDVISRKIVLFIRLPKCASTSFVSILKKLFKKGQLHLSFDPSGAADWDNDKIQDVFKRVQKESRSTKLRYVYARHFYFVNFEKFGLFNFTYVTIVREPVARFVSSYLYYHFSSRPHVQAILDPKHKNESLKTCLEMAHEGCQTNLMTKYFCGHEKPLCKKITEASYRQAKINIDSHFAVIGTMEEMALSYKLMKRLMPDHFQYLNPDADSLLVQNKNEHSIDIPHSLREEIEEKNKYDMLLYYYIRERLYMQAKACDIN